MHAYCAFYFEWLMPQLHTRYSGDLIDVFLYFFGATLFFFSEKIVLITTYRLHPSGWDDNIMAQKQPLYYPSQQSFQWFSLKSWHDYPFRVLLAC